MDTRLTSGMLYLQMLGEIWNSFLMKSIIFIFFVLVAASVSGQINKIDHIYAVSSNPEKLFLFFNKDLGLPVV